jgi:hypothetical protein
MEALATARHRRRPLLAVVTLMTVLVGAGCGNTRSVAGADAQVQPMVASESQVPVAPQRSAGDDEDAPTGDSAASPRWVASRDRATVVGYVGDSLAWEAQEYLSDLLPAGFRLDPATFGGWAPCDALPFVPALLENDPSVVMLSFSGNAMTACMAEQGVSTIDDIVSSYRSDIIEFRGRLGDVPMVLVLQPAMPSPFAPVSLLNDVYVELASSLPGTSTVDGGQFLEADGGWAESLPCLPVEAADGGCVDGQIRVRSDDGTHLCPTAPMAVAGVVASCVGWSSGAFRFALAMSAAIPTAPV